jgi:hypothetical protein
MAISGLIETTIKESNNSDRPPPTRSPEMKKSAIISATAAALIGGLLTFAPVASAAPAQHVVPVAVQAGVDPLLPVGTDPQAPVRLGYINSNHDEANTSNGYVDTAF